MNRTTARGIRALKDSQGQYLWERNVQLGQPEMLLGYPVYLTDAMDSVAANAFPVAFGNFRRAYILADHAAAGLRVTVDENISTPGLLSSISGSAWGRNRRQQPSGQASEVLSELIARAALGNGPGAVSFPKRPARSRF